jgi:hypothetical protein
MCFPVSRLDPYFAVERSFAEQGGVAGAAMMQ